MVFLKIVLAIAAAVCFTIWPIRMKASELSPIPAAFMYSTIAFVVTGALMLVRPEGWAEIF